ncbi:MAG: LysR family transcriptional regulator [Alphaproteobacteria bacterium]|nr:LysR family transcriptional regulator [Alphaproteobacteria bacterium]MCB9697643.1 LysR family transcriptional regulator [Alphaproteobacteria bacterium]
MDKLTWMDAFVRVVDAGGFAEAARRWGRSTSAVSKYVSLLEEDLGVRLLERTTRRCVVTDAGAAHAERCRRILLELEESEATARAEQRELRGVLRVTAPPGFLLLHRERVLASFAARHPGLQLEVDLTHRLVDLVDERIDVAIRLTDPQDSSLVARRLGPVPLALVASPAYLERAGVPRRPEDLADHACLADTNFRFHPRWPLRSADGGPVDVEVSGPVRANSPLLVGGLASDGLGIALVPRWVVDDDLASGALVEVLPGSVRVRWSVWAVTSRRRHLDARTTAFLDHLRQWAHQGE